jgi:PadR family transcriptional regulator, regulatory protein AphA
VQHLEAYLALQERRLRTYIQIEADLRQQSAQQEELFYPLLTVRYGIHRCQALIAWCDEALEALRVRAEQAARRSK